MENFFYGLATGFFICLMLFIFIPNEHTHISQKQLIRHNYATYDKDGNFIIKEEYKKYYELEED